MTNPLKLYVVRKYIYAASVADALRKERQQAPDDIWLDEDWKKSQTGEPKPMGYGFK